MRLSSAIILIDIMWRVAGLWVGGWVPGMEAEGDRDKGGGGGVMHCDHSHRHRYFMHGWVMSLHATSPHPSGHGHAGKYPVLVKSWVLCLKFIWCVPILTVQLLSRASRSLRCFIGLRTHTIKALLKKGTVFVRPQSFHSIPFSFLTDMILSELFRNVFFFNFQCFAMD